MEERIADKIMQTSVVQSGDKFRPRYLLAEMPSMGAPALSSALSSLVVEGKLNRNSSGQYWLNNKNALHGRRLRAEGHTFEHLKEPWLSPWVMNNYGDKIAGVR